MARNGVRFVGGVHACSQRRRLEAGRWNGKTGLCSARDRMQRTDGSRGNGMEVGALLFFVQESQGGGLLGGEWERRVVGIEDDGHGDERERRRIIIRFHPPPPSSPTEPARCGPRPSSAKAREPREPIRQDRQHTAAELTLLVPCKRPGPVACTQRDAVPLGSIGIKALPRAQATTETRPFLRRHPADAAPSAPHESLLTLRNCCGAAVAQPVSVPDVPCEPHLTT